MLKLEALNLHVMLDFGTYYIACANAEMEAPNPCIIEVKVMVVYK